VDLYLSFSYKLRFRFFGPFPFCFCHGHVSIGSKNCGSDYVVTCKHGLVRKNIGTRAIFKTILYKFWVDPEPAFYLNADPGPGSLTNGDHADPDPDPVQTWLSLKVYFLHEKHTLCR
jgi:hypothetical protein